MFDSLTDLLAYFFVSVYINSFIQNMENNGIYKIRSYTMEKRLIADLKNGNFTDVIFDVGSNGNQRIFKAHRLVLASENSEFEKLLRGSDSGKIRIPDMNPKAFENLIRYCYGTDLLFRDVESVLDTYLAAEKFKVKELQLATEKVIRLQSELSGIFLNKLNFLLDQKGLSSKRICPTTKNLSRNLFTNATENTISFEITEVESSQVEHESLLKEKKIVTDEVQASGLKDQKEVVEGQESLLEEMKIVTDEIQASGLKDQKEVVEGQESLLEEKKIVTDEVQPSGLKDRKEVVERAETIKPEDEKMRDSDNDSEDEDEDPVIREDVLKDFMVEVSHIIKSAVEYSSGETVKKLITEVERLSRHAAEEMEMAVADLEDSFTNFKPCD